jgi:hypothetical protein
LAAVALFEASGKISQNLSPAGVTWPFAAQAIPMDTDSVVPLTGLHFGTQPESSYQPRCYHDLWRSFAGIDFDSNNTIVNGGTITTSGVQSEGMFSMGNNNSALNSVTGTITTAGENSTGILVFGGGSGNTLTNRGTIMTSGMGSNGLGADGNGNQLINDGMITTSGAAAHGIFANGSNNYVVNSGTIYAPYHSPESIRDF